MRTSFRQVFSGLLLVVLDFSINGFDLLPDGVGYLLVAAGCRGLAAESMNFTIAAKLALLAALLWLIGFVVPRAFHMPYSLISTVAHCAMIWYTLGGVADLARGAVRPDLARRAESRRLWYVALLSAATVLASVGNSALATVAGLLGLATLFFAVLILHLIYRVGSELAE